MNERGQISGQGIRTESSGHWAATGRFSVERDGTASLFLDEMSGVV